MDRSISSKVPLREGVGRLGVPGLSGSAGKICDVVRRRLVRLDGREVGRDDDPSRSGRAVGFDKPGGTVGVERLLSFAI